MDSANLSPPTVSTRMEVFAYDVAISSHDLLKLGVTEAAHIHVVVAAVDDTEAALIACQMAACHGMPTRVYREF